MIIRRQNKGKDLMARKLLGLVYRLENIGNGDIVQSGELHFIADVSRQYPTPIVFFDIGANVGEYTATLATKRNNDGDSYHLFEPQKSCFEVLQNKFTDHTNIELNNIGLSDMKNQSTIYKDAEKSGLTSLYKRNLDYYNVKMDVEEKISLDTAENYIKTNNIKKIHLIKIDVEGNEIKTLTGFGSYLNSNFIDLIQFEYGGANIDSHTNLMDFYNLLLPRGFKIYKMMKHGLEPREYNPRLDNFVCQNYVAISEKALSSWK